MTKARKLTVKEKIALFPHSPGVYRYYDSEGNVIYVGKAKDLHKRVAQYFVSPDRLTRKTAVMVSKIADAQYSVVDTEADALLLENNLIKQYKPKYNILLKDSKTYPWICVSSEEFPKVYLTRRLVRDGSRYFGPYSSVMHARNLLELFSEIYPLRTCNNRITSDAILRKKFRPCLNYHIGKCRGCCIGAISRKEYNGYIDEIVRLLKGGGKEMIQHYRTLMEEAAASLDFEAANEYKEKMQSLEKHYSKSIIVSTDASNADVFSLEFDSSDAYGNFMRLRSGAVVQSLNLGFRMNIEEDRSEVLGMFIAEIQSKFGALSREVIVPFYPDVEIDGVTFRIPVRGDKLALLKLSAKNAKEMRFNSLKQKEHTDPDEFNRKVLEELRDALGMKELPVHIECFDNSNIQGTNPVASCVVFRGGVPSKKDYRHFNIKTVIGANDYASMKEVVNRRYSRMLMEAPDDLPQLIVIDGGKGQLAFAYEALSELGIVGKLTVVGLAKRLEEVIRVGDPYPLFIDRNSQALKVLQRIRDEAHRFGITHHRNRRSKAQVQSALREILRPPLPMILPASSEANWQSVYMKRFAGPEQKVRKPMNDNVKKREKILQPYDLFLIAGVILCNAIYSVLTGTFDPVGSAASVAGVACVVLVAKGSIWNYLFGLVNVSLYALISWKAALYGDTALNALYYLPMQFIGWWQWRRRGAAVSQAGSSDPDGDVRVKARRMTFRQRIVLVAACAVSVAAGGFLLRYLGDPQPFKDSATTVLSIIAQALMAMAFMEQWALWIITNVISIVMWCICVARGEAHAGVMVIMWTFYLLNSVNGLRVWLRLSRD